MQKFIIGLCFLFIINPIHIQSQNRQQQPPQVQVQRAQTPKKRNLKPHRWSIFTGLLVQNGVVEELAYTVPQGLYGQIFNVWEAGNSGMGIAIGGAYDYTFNNYLKFRFQAQLETTGWISGVIDVGIGIRLPVARGLAISFDTFFSVSQTGGDLGLFNSTEFQNGEQTQQVYIGFFGFKGRIALEFTIKKYFIAPYISYAAYPWNVSNIKNIVINGFDKGALIDSLQIGIEFGSRF